MPEPSTGPQVPPEAPRADAEKPVGELVFDVTEKTSGLIRDEIELAKAEVSEKVSQLARGSVTGIVAGVFAFLALILVMHGVAWLLADLVFGDEVWIGYLVEAAAFVVIGVFAALFAYRSFRAGAPPVPEQAIEEAKRTREVLEGDSGGTA